MLAECVLLQAAVDGLPEVLGRLRAVCRDTTRRLAESPVADADEFVNRGHRVASFPMPPEPRHQGLHKGEVGEDQFLTDAHGPRFVARLFGAGQAEHEFGISFAERSLHSSVSRVMHNVKSTSRVPSRRGPPEVGKCERA